MFSTQLGNLPNRGMETNNGNGDSNQSQYDKRKLIVNYIPQTATEDDLAAIFSPVGKVENIKIMREQNTGQSLGFGFVNYVTPEDATKAIELFNGYNFKNKRLKVAYSRPPGTDNKHSNLYITNLPRDITEEEVDNLFRDYGEIVQRTLLKDKVTGMPRGAAFVRFSKGVEAQAAISHLNGKMLENAMLPLNIRVNEDQVKQKTNYLDRTSNMNPIGFTRELDTDNELDPEEELIEAVYHRRPLWDFSLPERDRTEDKVEKLWREIAHKFEDRFSVEYLIKKWRQLRDAYNDQRRKLFVYVPGEDPPKVNFYYYQYMRFLNGEPTTFRKVVPKHQRPQSTITGGPSAMKKPKILPQMLTRPPPQMLTQPPPTMLTQPSKMLTPPPSDGVDGFLKMVGETLRLLPMRLRSKMQIKILQVLDEEALVL